MPRLTCTFHEFIEIIEARGFVLIRQHGGSHQQYRRDLGGEVHNVMVAAHSLSDTIKPNALNSMIRQSGLPKALFRK